MNVGVLIPGFSANEHDWCIPVYLNLVQGLAETESVRVFALRYPPRRAVYSVYGAEVHALGGHSGLRGIGRLRLWLRTLSTVIREHRRQPFSILHAIWADETGLLATWLGRLLHVPAVVSIAGGELVGFPEIGYGLQRSRFSRWVVRSALRSADRVIAPCQYAADQARAYVRPERLIVSPLGVDTDSFAPNDGKRTVNSQPFRLLAVGSLSAIKDHAAVIYAFAKLETRDATLTIAGDGPLRPTLLALAETLGVADRVHLIGAVEHDALPAIYRAADLHILTSQHEAFGMVTIEAAASGVATVGYARGVLPELADMNAGIAIPPGDTTALAHAIDSLLGNRTRLEAMRAAARKAALERYSLKPMTEGIRHIYATILDGLHQ